jgi:predicted transcriptional regulator
MTPTEFKSIRQGAGLSTAQLAVLLRISGSRSICRWEDGTRAVSGPVSLLMEMIRDGKVNTPAERCKKRRQRGLEQTTPVQTDVQTKPATRRK